MSNVKDLALFGDAITSTSTGIKLDEANALALSAYNKTIGTVAVDAFIYDTSKDSDGGAWRKRTEQTSWYNETLNTATRGSRREFPATAIIVIEATKVTIYDGDEPDCPMWMVFNYILGAHSFITYSDRSLSSVAALNGNIVLGGDDSATANGHVHIINFLKDNHERYTTQHSIASETISQRNEIVNYVPFGDGQSLVQVTVNDVAITSLPSAPIDDATGLPVPTIAAATDGGVSVITDSGNVWDITENSGPNSTHAIEFTDENKILFMWSDTSGINDFPHIGVMPIPTSDESSTYYYTSTFIEEDYSYQSSDGNNTNEGPSIVPDGNTLRDFKALSHNKSIGFDSGLGHIYTNPGDARKSLIAYTTSSYNTGWMPGDIKLTTLSDTTEETIGSVDYSDTSPSDGSELISNGTFDTDTTGWTAVNSTIEADTGRLKVTNTSAGVYGDATFTFSVTANEEYYINWEAFAGTGSIFIRVQGQGDDTGFISAVLTTSSYFYPTSSGDVTITVRVTELATSAVPVDAGDYAFIDNISAVQKNDIIYNGRFDGGTLGWTDSRESTISESGGQLSVQSGATVYGAAAVQAITTEIGKTYKATATCVTEGNNASLVLSSTADVIGEFCIVEFNGSETQSIVFRAIGTTTYVCLQENNINNTSVFDNVSVVEVAELVENGEFTTNTTGWTFEGTGTDTSAPGYLEYTAGAAVNTCATQAINTEIGKLYYVEANYVSGTSSGAIYIGTSAFGTNVGSTQFALGGYKIFNTFKATTTTTYISLIVGSGTETGRFDNVSVKEADELVENGDFGRLTTGWTAGDPESLLTISTTSTNGKLRITNNDSTPAYADSTIITEVGKTYTFTAEYIGGSGGLGRLLVSDVQGTILDSTSVLTAGIHSLTFVARETSTEITLSNGSNSTLNGYLEYDNVSVRLAEADRSSYQDGLQIHGQLTKSAVTTGAELIAYSGWSTEHYLEQPYNANLDFGTGDFCISTWAYGGSDGKVLFGREQVLPFDEDGGFLFFQTSGVFRFYIRGDGETSWTNWDTSGAYGEKWTHFAVARSSGVLYFYINGNLDQTQVSTHDVTNPDAKLFFGRRSLGTLSQVYDGKLALPKISATAPTAEQIKKIYEDEKKLFDKDAKCTIYGSSDDITALAYDDKYKQLHVGTSAGRSVFNGLVRAENTTTAVATVISANNKMVAEQ